MFKINPWKLERMKRNFNENFSFTYLFLAIQAALFVVMTLAGGSTNGQVLVNFGAKFNPYIIHQHEYYRFLTPIFLHIGLEHILFNSVFLYMIGRQMEYEIGHWRFLAVYLLSGVMGNLASFAFSSSISAGASTALFGLMGAVVYLSRKHGYIRSFRQMGVQYAGLLIINIVLGFINSAVDNYGHLGGLVGGYLVMTAISFRGDRLTKPASRIAGIVAYFVIAILLFALGMKR